MVQSKQGQREEGRSRGEREDEWRGIGQTSYLQLCLHLEVSRLHFLQLFP